MNYLVPEFLDTERLTLRPFRDNDWQALHAYYGSSEATRFTVGHAFTEGETWRAMCSMVGHWQIRGYGPYALEEKQTGRLLGTAGFWYPNDWPEPEIKWALAPEHWGKGYASEAARAIQSAAHAYIPDTQLISFIHADNRASIMLAKAIKATFELEVEFRGALWHLYRHPAAEPSVYEERI